MKTFTNKAQEQVKEFHQAFGHPVSDKPTSLTLERTINRCIWNGEELVEQIKAVSVNDAEFRESFISLLNGLKKAYQKELVKPYLKTKEERTVAQIDAVTDRLYFTMGDAVELGIDIQEVMNIVHSANMSKLFTDEDGNKYAKYGDDGKIQKSPDFWSPEDKIAEEVERQLQEAKTEELKRELEDKKLEEEKSKRSRKKKEVVELEFIKPIEDIEDTDGFNVE